MPQTVGTPLAKQVNLLGDRFVMRQSKTIHTTKSVVSKDGTKIGYIELGQGPGVILVHGGMETAESHVQLAEELSSDFTVYLPDRRGRGMSGPFGEAYSLHKDVEDMQALIEKTGVEFLFGQSSGAIISLQTALEKSSLKKVAVYEPPLSSSSIPGTLSTDWVKPFGEKVANGDRVGALIFATKATQQFGHSLPAWLIRLIAPLMLKDMLELIPTFQHDAQLVVETRDKWDRFKDIKADVLLMGGGLSPSFLPVALGELEKLIPHVRRVFFPELNHGGSGNRNRGGNPKSVAAELRTFFSA